MSNCENTTDGWVSRSRAAGPPSAPCVDTSPQCADWAAQGRCIYTPDAMLASCPVSCGACQGEIFNPCARHNISIAHWKQA
jgi:hypothetical protein